MCPAHGRQARRCAGNQFLTPPRQDRHKRCCRAAWRPPRCCHQRRCPWSRGWQAGAGACVPARPSARSPPGTLKGCPSAAAPLAVLASAQRALAQVPLVVNTAAPSATAAPGAAVVLSAEAAQSAAVALASRPLAGAMSCLSCQPANWSWTSRVSRRSKQQLPRRLMQLRRPRWRSCMARMDCEGHPPSWRALPEHDAAGPQWLQPPLLQHLLVEGRWRRLHAGPTPGGRRCCWPLWR
mmetsp:Transcript_133648/g.415650  ORF Transcript_133648/g.415650 Transcript_133648/m.415650 type:complete len:238 (-) Transcript_133648:770-1483(-)